MPDRPWLTRYDPDVPESLQPYPDGTLLDFVARLSRERPEGAAILFKGTRLSWRELDRQSDAFAAALAARGVGPGDRVALLLPNCPQFVIAELGVWKAGGVVVALNPIYTEREIETPLRETETRVVVALTRFYGRVKAVQPRTSVRLVMATNIKEYLPPVLRVLFTLFREKKEGHRVTLAAGDEWMGDVLAAHRGQPAPAVGVDGEDEAVILASGGTTGLPKGVVGLHKAFVMSGLQLRHWTKSLCEAHSDVILLPLPLFHVYANVGVQAMAIVGGNPMALVPNPRDIGDLIATIRKTRPAFFTSVPTLFTALLNNPAVQAKKVDFSSIKVSFSGSAALMAETKRQFESLTGGRIIEGYSLTEGMMACLVNPIHNTNKIGSIGLPLPDVEARIVDTETGLRLCAPGEAGELILHAPQLMDRYWQNEEETAQSLRDHDGRVWLHTGDIGYMDEEGYVFLTDRKKDMIKTSGFQVWPREIEEVMTQHPAVSEVGVAGVPDAVKGEVPKAWVVLKAGAASSEAELRAYCREKLAPYKVPASIEFRTELPKTMVGKVLRRVLAADHQRSA